MVNFTIWSPLISFAAIALFYPLIREQRTTVLVRVFAAILLLPALISSFYLLILIASQQVYIAKTYQIPIIPLLFGAHFSFITAIIITGTTASASIFLFFLPKKKFAENISLATLLLSFIFLISIIPDQFIGWIFFSIGTVIITYSIFTLHNEKDVVTAITNDFFFQRSSDLFLFLSLVIILMNGRGELDLSSLTFHPTSKILYFVSLSLRLIGTTVLFDIEGHQSSIKYIIIRNIFVTVGTSLLFLKFLGKMAFGDNIDIAFLITTGLLSGILLVVALLNQKLKSLSILPLFAMSAAVFTISLGHIYTSLVIILSILILYPYLSLPNIFKNSFYIRYNNILKTPLLNRWVSIIKTAFLSLPFRVASFFARLFTNFLHPFYAGFFLYRLPQIVVTLLESPLRLFHNGSVHRSFAFIALVLLSYYYWGVFR